jgi:hypothetical protein
MQMLYRCCAMAMPEAHCTCVCAMGNHGLGGGS